MTSAADYARWAPYHRAKPPRTWHGHSNINWMPHYVGGFGRKFYVAMIGGFWYRATQLPMHTACGKAWQIEAIENEGVWYV